MRRDFRSSLRVVVSTARWWFGLSYVTMGVGVFIAGPIMIGQGDYAGVYMIIGGSSIAVAGWAIHPWGLQRRNARRSAATPR